MPLFRLNIKSVSRSEGRSSVAAAAYRAGERLRDERTGKVHNYGRRRDVVHTEILLPSPVSGAVPDWMKDRAQLWNAVEVAERRRNSRVAREFQVALPHELSAPRRLELARSFAREIADRYGVLVDLAIHDPKPENDPRNFHAHLLTTTRAVGAAGLGAKAGLDMSLQQSLQRGQMGLREMHFIRERWAVLTNAAYRDAGLDFRVDHRSLLEQGIDREPRHKSYVAYQIEQRQLRRESNEMLADRYRERVATSQSRQPEEAPSVASTADARLEELRRRARESWRASRGREAPEPEPEPMPSAEEDLGL